MTTTLKVNDEVANDKFQTMEITFLTSSKSRHDGTLEIVTCLFYVIMKTSFRRYNKFFYRRLTLEIFAHFYFSNRSG